MGAFLPPPHYLWPKRISAAITLTSTTMLQKMLLMFKFYNKSTNEWISLFIRPGKVENMSQSPTICKRLGLEWSHWGQAWSPDVEQVVVLAGARIPSLSRCALAGTLFPEKLGSEFLWSYFRNCRTGIAITHWALLTVWMDWRQPVHEWCGSVLMSPSIPLKKEQMSNIDAVTILIAIHALIPHEFSN